jgi:hypothetical protein
MKGDPILDENTYVLFPNKKKNIKSTQRRSLQPIITEKSERNKKDKTIKHVENWKLFAQKLSRLELQSEEMRQMLNRMLTRLNFPEPQRSLTVSIHPKYLYRFLPKTHRIPCRVNMFYAPSSVLYG